jgi:hypothetical protein
MSGEATIAGARPRRLRVRPSHRDATNPHHARALQPGVSGFLFTVNPNQPVKARNEAMAVLGQYLDRVLGDDDVEPQEPAFKRNRPESGAAAEPSEAPTTVAASLAAELGNGATHGGHRPDRVRHHALLREVQTKVKGYMFISVAQPRGGDGPNDDNTATAADAAEDGASVPPADEGLDQSAPATGTVASVPGEVSNEAVAATADGQRADTGAAAGVVTTSRFETLPEENSLVSAVADAMWDDLAANPRPVARFTFRCYPVPVSTIPTRKDLIAAAARRAAVTWREEALLGDSDVASGADGASNSAERAYCTAPVAVWIGVTVRNNSNLEHEKTGIQSAVAVALSSVENGRAFIPQPYYVAKSAPAVARVRPTLYVSIMIIHSVALVSVQPSYPDRLEYNLGDVSSSALKLGNMVGGSAQTQ